MAYIDMILERHGMTARQFNDALDDLVSSGAVLQYYSFNAERDAYHKHCGALPAFDRFLLDLDCAIEESIDGLENAIDQLESEKAELLEKLELLG